MAQSYSMLPAADICERARLSRDPRFDGRFFVAVVTTGIYCRPVCPARTPGRDNVRFYPTAAACEEAGYRPCLRCLPETAAGLPEWSIASRTVLKGLRLMDAGVLEDGGIPALAERLDVSVRHLNRLFASELGATPKALAMTRRRALAKRLIDATDLPLGQVAERAGYGSLRRFNDDLSRCYGRSPSALRNLRRGLRVGRRPDAGERIELTLAVRPPFDAPWMFEFLGRRALAGCEEVEGLCYRRRVRDGDGVDHWIEVAWQGNGLRLAMPSACALSLSDVLTRVRRVFDLDADPATVSAHLVRDPLLAPLVAEYPGLRVPGAWDGFETAVRAVLGQQVSVDRATALAHALLARYGGNVLRSPNELARTNPAEIGMPGRRGQAVARLAAEAAEGRLVLDETADPEGLYRSLCEIPGIGPWTAGYIGMRVARDPDALPANDWVVMKMLEAQGLTGRAARARTDAWRPWRAYGVMYLWKLSQLERERAATAAREAG